MPLGQLEKMASGLRELRRNEAVEIHERVDLRAWTALGVGGLASLVVRCHNTSAVQESLDLAAAHGLKWVVLGGGTRLIPPNRVLRVPVLSLTGALGRWEMELDGMVAGAGANLAQVCRAATRTRLSGLEAIQGSGHSIGGLVRAVADRAMRGEEVIHRIEVCQPGGDGGSWLEPGDGEPSDSLLRRRVVTRVRFRLRPARPVVPVPPQRAPMPTRGPLRTVRPVFLDMPDASAADLLSEAGISTAVVGGVRLGGESSNQLTAGRSATATDVLDVCRRARDRVAASTGLELRSALVFVDEDGSEIAL